MGYLRRCAAVALATLAVGILGSATVLGAAAWILTISPTSTTVGASTPFVLTATNVDQGQRIGCIVVDVPGAFQIGATAIVWASGGGEWTIARSGNRVTATAVASARLDVNEQLQFRVTATAQQSGTFGWASAAY
ncbi:MAG: hypothetical protein ACXWWU_01745, partial [Candidatus Limnocylindria bacterium]